jgi:uncharacterized Fe-S cluster-containing radical SAM superfamily protein
MTKREAIQAMISGEKVTHKYFTDKEYIFIDGILIADEGGCKFQPYEFWAYRNASFFETDWEIYKK